MASDGDGDITVDLEGEDGIDPRAVADAIAAVEKLVKSVAVDEPPTLVLTDMSVASAHITMRATGAPTDVLHDGLSRLRTSPERPAGWHRDSLEAVIDLAKVAKLKGVESVQLRIGSIVERIDADLQDHAKTALEPQSRSLGAVRGVIYRYTNDIATHNRSAALRNVHTRESVLLRFDNEIAAKVRANLENEVEVWGELERDDEEAILQIRVEGIEPIEPDERQDMGHGRGILGPDWTGGIDPVDWVRSQRG
jgi:hypothetical protein